MRYDIPHLHHVGHVVADMADARELYRRLGFAVPPPRCPAMALREGAPPQPFGAANTHADFPHNFVELVTSVDGGGQLPPDTKLVPLEAPAALVPQLVERIGATTANLAACLARFEGLHILMFSSADIDATAARLDAAGVAHGGVNTVRRPVDQPDGPPIPELVRYLEVADAPEGRIGAAADTTAPRPHSHPNGAVSLVDVVLCVADRDLPDVLDRYGRYVGRPARRAGAAHVFALAGATLTVVAASDLGTLLPGERAPDLPALVAYTVAVRDISAAHDLIRGNGLPLRRTPAGDLFVPAAAARGAAIGFRQDG